MIYTGYIAQAKATVLGIDLRQVDKPDPTHGYYVELWYGHQFIDRFATYEAAITWMDKRIATLEKEV